MISAKIVLSIALGMVLGAAALGAAIVIYIGYMRRQARSDNIE